MAPDDLILGLLRLAYRAGYERGRQEHTTADIEQPRLTHAESGAPWPYIAPDDDPLNALGMWQDVRHA